MGPQPPLFHLLNGRYRSQGYALLGFTRVTPTEATARVRNNLTGDVGSLAVRVESEAPHRIVFLAPAPVPPEPPKPAPTDDQKRLNEISAFVNRLAEADAFSGVC